MTTVGSVIDFLTAVLEIGATWYPHDLLPEIWYRGASNHAHGLIPGAYWRTDCDEESMVLSFKSMAPALLPREPVDDWEWYFLMQHYGLPTRLLDWTEIPLTALYFALESENPAAPCVWVFDPLALNALNGLDSILVPVVEGWPDSWLPGACGRGAKVVDYERDGYKGNNSKPIAIFPKRHNPRIVAQRGTFTVHGVDETPINELDLSAGAGTSRLTRIDIDPAARLTMWHELGRLGVSKTAIYPEPQSVAEDLKRMYRINR